MGSPAQVVFLGLLVFVLVACPPPGALAVNVEGAILLKWKGTFTLDSLNDTANWNATDKTPCTWSGITCDTKLHVVSIFFTYVFSGTVAGTLIPELGQLQHLDTVDVSTQQFSGPIPPELGQLRLLTTLNLLENQLSGPIPPELGNCSRLTSLGLAANLLSGPVPASLFRLPSLSSLRLNLNPALRIPQGLSALRPSLTVLSLSGESLPLELWPELGSLTGLQGLDIKGPPSPGTPIPFPPWIQKLSSLNTLSLRNTSITGPAPAWLQQLPLQFLVLTDQDLTAFPALGPSVSTLNMSGNPRMGSGTPDLSASLGALNMSGMYALYLDNCSLAGPLPSALQSASSMTTLSLASNALTGPLPRWLATAMPRLNTLDLSNNQLSGGIPGNLGLLPIFAKFLLSHNQLTGSIPASLGNWTQVFGTVGLDHNRLSGPIPEALNTLHANELHLDHNQLTGEVPALKATYGGSLDSNFLIGQLPSNFTAGENCFGFQLSSPQQSPLPGQRSAAECRAAYKLLPSSPPPPAPPSFVASTKRNKHVAAVVGGTVGAVCLLSLLLVLLFCGLRRWRQRRMARAVAELDEKQRALLDGLQLQQLSPHDLAKATSNWSAACRLGEGSYGPVYKGILADGKLVAIKKAREGSGQGVNEFLNEVSTIGKVSSSHIVSLVGFGLEERTLVYEFMPNGSLEDALFRANYPKKLTWREVQNILLGVAEGLVYLHTQCRPKIIHRDIKPANVLLDANYNPRIADFGLAKTMTKEGDPTKTRVLGTFGYVAPEYALHNQLTEKSDVYSFGVLVLVAVNRNDQLSSFSTLSSEGLTEKFSELLQGSKVLSGEQLESQFLGRAYVGQVDREEVARVVQVSAWCTISDLHVRPSMTTVVSWLNGSAPVPPLGSDNATFAGMASGSSGIESSNSSSNQTSSNAVSHVFV